MVKEKIVSLQWQWDDYALHIKTKRPDAFASGLCFQRYRDSNPNKQSQSLSCYRYTIPLHNDRYYIRCFIVCQYLFCKKMKISALFSYFSDILFLPCKKRGYTEKIKINQKKSKKISKKVLTKRARYDIISPVGKRAEEKNKLVWLNGRAADL